MSERSQAGEVMRAWIDQQAFQAPARLALVVFAAVIVVIAGLLALPASSSTGESIGIVNALFTATSAVCVTGLTVVDTGTDLSFFGQAVVLAGIKIGGLGIMSIAALLGLAVSRRLGLTQRLLAQDESRATGLGDVRSHLKAIVIISAAVEAALTVILLPRLLLHHDNVGVAVWESFFYAISAFNNAGFVPAEGGLTPFASDVWMLLPIATGVLIGSLGFPVYVALLRGWRRPSKWPLHTKLTLAGTGILGTISVAVMGIFEWRNADTLGGLGTPEKFLNMVFMSINQRSGGFSTFASGATQEHTWLFEDVMMFIGGGSGGTAGGIRVTTFVVIVLAMVAEIRGRRDVEAYGKRIGTEVVRVAISVFMFGLITVVIGTVIVLMQTSHLEGFTLDRVLYDVISAYATCGLSTGVAMEAPDPAKLTLTVLMYMGRIGSMTLAAALALNNQLRVIRLPSERPIIG